MEHRRRALLKRLGAGAGVALLAGCTGAEREGDDGGGASTDDPDGDGGGADAETDGASGASDDADDEANESSVPDEANVRVESQTTDGTSIAVRQADLPDGGFVAVRDADDRTVGVSGYLPPGRHKGVEVRLFEGVPGAEFDRTELGDDQTVTAVLHRDEGGDERYEFVAADREADEPYRDDDRAVEDRAEIAVSDGRDANPPELWHSRRGARVEAIESASDRFAEQSDYEVDVEQVDAVLDRVETATSADEGPALYDWSHDLLGSHVERDFVYDAAADLDVDLEATFVDGAAEAVAYEGGVYGLPYECEAPTLLYDRNVVDSPPETLAELEAIAREHHDPANGQYGFAMPFDEYHVSAYVHAFGGFYFDGETERLGHGLSETHRGVELVRDVLWQYAPADPGYDPQSSTFGRGNAPLAINGPWSFDRYRESPDVDLGVAPLPTVDGAEPAPYISIRMLYFGAALDDADDRFRESALSFAEWYATDDERIVAGAEDHGAVPVRSGDADDSELPEDVRAIAESCRTGTAIPSHPKMARVWEPTNRAIERVLVDGEDVETAFERAEETIRSDW